MIKRLLSLFLFFGLLSACAPSQPTPVPVQTATSTQAPAPGSHAWWEQAVFYEVFVRSFYDSDGDGIGDFNGITQKLDYLDDLGVTALWLMPIHPSPSYHGYDVLNYYEVNPQYGTMKDFKHFLEEAHNRGMHVIVDLVLNHTSSAHPYFVEADSDPNSKYRDWYIWSDTDEGNYWHPGNHGFYYAFFSAGMPDLNYRNPAVTTEMFKVVHFWLDDVGIDGFRVDAAKHLIEEDGKVENTRSTHDWYQKFYAYYKSINPNTYAVGEAFGAGGFIARTYEGQLDQVFNFELASGFMASARAGTNTPLNSALKFSLNDKPDLKFATFLTNHDQDRVMSVLDGDIGKAKLAAFLLLTSPGTPFIYYGEEIGMQGRKPDEDIRVPMQWDSQINAGFSTGTPWHTVNQDYLQVNVANQKDASESLFNHYRRLIGLRRGHSALQTGKLLLVKTGNSAIHAILRGDESESLLILANLGNEAISEYSLTLSQAGLRDKAYSTELLFGSGETSALQVTQGSFQNYKPVPELGPYSTLLIRLIP